MKHVRKGKEKLNYSTLDTIPANAKYCYSRLNSMGSEIGLLQQNLR